MRWLGVLIAMMSSLVLGMWQPIVPSVAAQRVDLSGVQVLAIAPFDDEVYVPILVQQGTAKLSELLGRAPFRVIGAPEVAVAMKRLGLAPRDLISPARTIDLGKAVGADAVLTGRVTYALRERSDGRDEASKIVSGGGESRVDMNVRVLNVNTRLRPLEQGFSCQVAGLLQSAMDCVMRDVASRLIP